ncbi:hypothetical protein [Tropicibacter sp. S64]|uniref:hypothetical protein n=1 Tax=Tropicibacter sp. S64 TaxID=3415122 RepID=UPI003C7DCD2D
MKHANILAHRGWWTDVEEKNSFEALKRALDAGFGIETDFRDLNGTVVVSHDPPVGEVLTAEAFFDLYARSGADGRLALNIKADGLQKPLLEVIGRTGAALDNCYAFDMAVPDALGYLNHTFPAYTRISEYEAVPSFLDRAAGVWVDNFTGDFPQVAEAQRLMAAGHRACIVSPELHRRAHHALWDAIAAAGLHENPLFELCTDLPQDAYDLLGTE